MRRPRGFWRCGGRGVMELRRPMELGYDGARGLLRWG